MRSCVKVIFVPELPSMLLNTVQYLTDAQHKIKSMVGMEKNIKKRRRRYFVELMAVLCEIIYDKSTYVF